jgi:SAM-dependent methyltransferase
MTVPGDSERPSDRRPYRLYWCDGCSLGQIHPRPSQAEVDAFYDIRYHTHAGSEAGGGAPVDQTPWERLRERLAWAFDRGTDLDADRVHRLVRGRSSSVCDLGCGNGGLLSALRDRGHRVVGLEPDPVARQLAVARGLEVHAGHAEELPDQIAGDTFDVVVLCHVLQQCLDPGRVLQNARKLLRPGGLLICETPNNEALGLQQSGACWRWLDVPRHLNLFTVASLVRFVAGVGLKVARVEFVGYTRQFKGAWLEAEARKRAALYPSRPASRLWQSLRSWQLLARTALARRERKYDSVRVIVHAAAGAADARRESSPGGLPREL